MSVHYRQGDVLLLAVESVPFGAAPEVPFGAAPVPREDSRLVLAHDEATGHRHAIDEQHAYLFSLDDDEMISDRFL
jgi:hypothetical protein